MLSSLYLCYQILVTSLWKKRKSVHEKFYGWKPERNGADKRLGCDSGVWKDPSVWRHAFGTATPQERYGRIKESNHLEMHDSPEQLRKALNWHSCQFPSPLMFLTSVKIYNNKIIQRKLIKIQCYFKVTCSIFCNNFKLNTINNETSLFSKCGYISDKFSWRKITELNCVRKTKKESCALNHMTDIFIQHISTLLCELKAMGLCFNITLLLLLLII